MYSAKARQNLSHFRTMKVCGGIFFLHNTPILPVRGPLIYFSMSKSDRVSAVHTHRRFSKQESGWSLKLNHKEERSSPNLEPHWSRLLKTDLSILHNLGNMYSFFTGLPISPSVSPFPLCQRSPTIHKATAKSFPW